jgi:hypothetical protein
MTKDEALDLALEALDIVKIHFTQNRHVNEAITAIEQALAAQPAVQEPVGTYGEIFNSMRSLLRSGIQRDQQIYMAMQDKPLYTTPPEQPAVPDAFGTREGEHPQYIQGWNDCRAEMLKGMKP